MRSDNLYRALAALGQASRSIAWANTIAGDDIPEDLTADMRRVYSDVHELQDKLRDIREGKEND